MIILSLHSLSTLSWQTREHSHSRGAGVGQPWRPGGTGRCNPGAAGPHSAATEAAVQQHEYVSVTHLRPTVHEQSSVGLAERWVCLISDLSPLQSGEIVLWMTSVWELCIQKGIVNLIKGTDIMSRCLIVDFIFLDDCSLETFTCWVLTFAQVWC